MFEKITSTKYPPAKPTLIWDGTCGFCKWWKIRWETKTKDRIHFVPYQDVAKDFPDIPIKEFKKASRLIEPDGKIYTGPDSAYRSLYYAGTKKWHLWYEKYPWFESLSNLAYNHVAKNRSVYFKLTKLLFGKDPHQPKLYWFYYILILLTIILLV
ncbi:thiol-disulfide oxidoreductase DCC family protein [Gillisia limnaea]|uniref:Thiol-disulfide oxidoreductase DCC n=1 Tax=Gillisia limnaea (strain DSM 15749 / LMG 21470 / R-8282) TaxID=865937 RepID=H2BSB0_GILLR|nr:DCC1-like thiol-disulfide oxidoreductase family protein [Gillisia limnaea]EHQ01433.1 thiol-disulfide oxidoreductase DCC [Gillisia limnaea DSM 15749]